MATVQGKLGMTKALKKQARLSAMDGNRKRDKARWRSSYHSEFRNVKGPSPADPTCAGIVRSLKF